MKGNLKTHPPKSKKMWAAIRWCSDGYHWIDISNMSIVSREECEIRTKRDDLKMPNWARDNPVVVYREVTVQLVETP